MKFTWIKQGSETPTDGGDQYTGWDRFGRAIDLRWIDGSGNHLERLQHGYDRASNRLYRANLVASSSDKQEEFYSYDGLYQLTDFQRGALNSGRTAISGTPAAEEAFTYDPAGNWNNYLVKANGSTTLDQDRGHNEANELVDIDGSSSLVAEDEAGNMTKVPKPGSWSSAYDLKYDAWNRLVEVKDGSTTVGAYRYDGLNRRVSKAVSGITRHFYYSDHWQIVEERLGSSTDPDRQFVWGIRYVDDLVLRDRDTNSDGTLDERLYVIQDYFQPTAVVDTGAAVQERYGYEAFGTSRIMTASYGSRSSSNFDWETRFGAYRWDAETNLYQVRFRFLHATIGRWISRDHLGIRSGTNLISYVRNRPVNRVDSIGLQEEDDACPSEIMRFYEQEAMQDAIADSIFGEGFSEDQRERTEQLMNMLPNDVFMFAGYGDATGSFGAEALGLIGYSGFEPYVGGLWAAGGHIGYGGGEAGLMFGGEWTSSSGYSPISLGEANYLIGGVGRYSTPGGSSGMFIHIGEGGFIGIGVGYDRR